MKTFVLIDFSHGAGLVHIYGTIVAIDAKAAAASIGSEIEYSHEHGALSLRHRLKESKSGFNEWFLEEINSVDSRPREMDLR